jgi:hypothetical protein
MEIEYEDEEATTQDNNKLNVHETNESKEDRLINHITNTKNYDPTKFNIISPEKATEEIEREMLNNPNPEFSQAIQNIEKATNRILTKEEYIKAADTYATILAERDEEKKKNYEGKYEINPIRKEKYFELLLNNIPVTNALAESMKTFENSLIAPLMDALEKSKKDEVNVLELKKKARVNLRYKGKCRIAADEGGKVIIIDNKNDVDLLRMKYRKEWIEKKYPEVKNQQITNVLENDEFE